MSEIWNLSALCRCCHTDGNFKSLQIPYMYDGHVETYSVLLLNTFGINIKPPPFEASYTICDDCIAQLRDAAKFKRKVLSCEKQFDEYCKNEQALATHSDFVRIKEEFPDNIEYITNNDSDVDEKYDDDDDNVDDKGSVKLDGGQGTDFKYIEIENSPVKIKREDESLGMQIEISIEAPKEKKENKSPVVQKKRQKRINTQKPRLSKKKIKKKTIDPTLEVHVKTENGELYSCKECGGSYDLLKKLRVHIYDNHIRPTLKCEHCPKKFKSEITFKNHLVTHGDERPYKCTYCTKDFKIKKSLLDHLNSHTREKTFKCDICQKEFCYKSILTKHIKWHNGTNKKCMCETCGHSFNDSTNLRKHVQAVHEKLRPFCCDVCSKTFSAKKHLVNHIRMHNGEKPYTCDICSSSFSSCDHMKRHKLVKHNFTTTKYTCIVCNKVYLDRGKFRSHVRSHTGSLPFKCHLCSKDFSCKYSMKRHVNEHFGLKPHTCEICQKSFTQKTQLNRHMKNLHNPDRKLRGEKVKCDVCKINVYDLEKHKKSHFIRPHKCDFCEKTYSERNALNRHIRSIHFGRKNHECNVCGKKYTNIGSLKTHKVKVHKLVLKKEMEDNFDDVLTTFTIPNESESVDDDNMQV